MTFGEAIDVVKQGKAIARKGWNGKDQCVIACRMADCISLSGKHYAPEHDDIGNIFLMFVGTSGYQCGWLASQADMLAEDWFIKEEEE